PAAGLRHAAAGISPEPVAPGTGPATPGGRDRLPGGAAHLGPEPALAPARPLRRAGRGNRPGCRALDLLPAGLLPAGARTQPAVPGEVPGHAWPRLRPRIARLPRPTAASGRSPGVPRADGSVLAEGVGGVRQAAIRRPGAGAEVPGAVHAPGGDLQRAAGEGGRGSGLLPLEGLRTGQC